VRSKLLDDSNGRRTYMLVFDIGEEVTSTLLAFAADRRLEGSHFTAIGAFEDVVLGWFDWDLKDYRRNRMAEQVEVVSLAGNIALSPTGDPGLHAHVAVARRDGSAWGGHLLEAHVRPTLEVVLTESPEHLRRTYDQETGMAALAP
jgi:uncharacterized protein